MAVTGLAALCVGGGIVASGVASAGTSGPSAAVGAARTADATTAVTDITHESGPAVTETWSHSYSGVTAQSSPAPFALDGRPAVVVGSRAGQLHAYYLSDGDTVPGWPVTVPGAEPVDSTASVAGGLIYVGTGNASRPTGGGYLALREDGKQVWYRQVAVTPGGSTASGVQASLTVGYLEGSYDSVIAGSLGQQLDALVAPTGALRSGFPWFASDTVFSTAAIADLYGNGRDDIVEGGQQTAGYAMDHQYTQGGHVRVISPTGRAGAATANGGTVCDLAVDQGVYSSPAVGRFLGSSVGIVVGTGSEFAGAAYTDKLIATNTHCQPVWVASLDGSTQSSPSLVDALGNGSLQVAEGTASGSNGTVYLLDSSTGAVHWATDLPGAIVGGIGSADLGGGYQDLIVPTTGGAYILNGRTGAVMDVLGRGQMAEQDSPLVTDDPDGRIGITLAGYNAGGGVVAHYELAGTRGADYDQSGAWPEFHHDPALSGSTLAPVRG